MELTNKEVLAFIQQYAEQSKKHIAFGFIANAETGNVSTFIKGKDIDIISFLCAEMNDTKDLRKLIIQALTTFYFFNKKNNESEHTTSD